MMMNRAATRAQTWSGPHLSGSLAHEVVSDESRVLVKPGLDARLVQVAAILVASGGGHAHEGSTGVPAGLPQGSPQGRHGAPARLQVAPPPSRRNTCHAHHAQLQIKILFLTHSVF